MLSDEQLKKYNDFASKISKAHADADCLESIQINITYSFSPFGRCVEVNCGTQRLTLEDCF